MGGSTGATGSCPKGGGSPAVVPEFTAHTAKHLFEGEINKAKKAVGVHSDAAIAGGTAVLTTPKKMLADPPGIYEAKVAVKNASGALVHKKRESTFFPDSWSQQKIKEEVSGAFKNKTTAADGKWLGTSPSGVKIEGYLDPHGNIATAYPKYP